jgi:pyruvate dehydrogenase E2 component (dihydrolipoamide acetyltransferase)
MAIRQPQDKSHFILPDLGEGLVDAELIRWRVAPGESVAELQPLAEVETDKALTEVPSPWAGVVKELHASPGDRVKVGSVLVSFQSARESGSRPAPAGAEGAVAPEEADVGTVVGSVETGLRVPQRLTERAEAPGEASGRTRALATPAVRRVARELGVDIDRIAGTGRGGRVTARDVYAHHGGAEAAPAAPPKPAPVVSGDGIVETIPFRGVRRTIAESLHRSISTAVHFTVTEEADVTALDDKRREYAAVLGRKLSFLPLVMRAVCLALRRHPRVNAVVDDPNSRILVKGGVNLGCAVDTEHGLMVPVIPNADALSIVQLADEVADLARRCRDRTIERARLIGGTFTVSNVGAYGGIFATPIINYPEVAILGVGRVREQVLVRQGKFYAGRVMPLSLSCDHRVVDGAAGARFLETVRTFLEQPEGLVAAP